MPVKAETTSLLLRSRAGDAESTNALFSTVYDELHRIASRLMANPARDGEGAEFMVDILAELEAVDEPSFVGAATRTGP